MPHCGCYHNYDLVETGPGVYQIDLDLEGVADVKRLFEDTGLAVMVGVDGGSRFQHSTGNKLLLSGVTEVDELTQFCHYWKSVIFLNLAPQIDHCYALGPYSLFNDNSRSLSEIGRLVNRAKYRKEGEAADDLAARLLEVIDVHPVLAKSTAIAVPPKSAPGPRDLPLKWAEYIAGAIGCELVVANKTRQTPPQKTVEDTETEEEVVGRIRHSFVVNSLPKGSRVLMLDDTIRSGGTMVELARALREAGASHVYGLSAAKDAKFTFGGINLNRDVWP